jgi:ribosomal protein S18
MLGVIVEIESAVDIDYQNSDLIQYIVTENQRHDPSRLTE